MPTAHLKLISLLWFAAFFAPVLQAAPGQQNSVESISTLRDSQSSGSDESRAQEWNLNPLEWQRYKSVMAGPRGIYSPDLDPLSALGIEARSDEERRHFAELQVQAEAQRTAKELAYQRAYDDAWKRLYPNLMPVQLGAEPPHRAPLCVVMVESHSS